MLNYQKATIFLLQSSSNLWESFIIAPLMHAHLKGAWHIQSITAPKKAGPGDQHFFQNGGVCLSYFAKSWKCAKMTSMRRNFSWQKLNGASLPIKREVRSLAPPQDLTRKVLIYTLPDKSHNNLLLVGLNGSTPFLEVNWSLRMIGQNINDFYFYLLALPWPAAGSQSRISSRHLDLFSKETVQQVSSCTCQWFCRFHTNS